MGAHSVIRLASHASTRLAVASLAILFPSCAPDAPAEAVHAAAPVPTVPVAEIAAPAVAPAPEPTALEPTAPETAAEPAPAKEPVSPLVLRLTQPDTSDWPEIVRRGVLRVLVVRDRTNFFVAEGELRGFEYELCVELEKSIADSPGSDRPRVDVAFVPVALDELVPALVEGRGDFAAGALTITPEREQLVAFTEPYVEDVAQIVVSHKGAPPLASLDDLAGRTVCVAPGTSYLESLAQLNARFAGEQREPVRVEVLGRGVVTEDVLELVNSGAFHHTVVDGHVAEMWAGALENLRLEPALRLTQGDRIAWAVRKANPELLGVLDAFVRENRRGTKIGNVLFKRYLEGTRWIVDPEPDLRSGRLAPYVEPLQRLSAQYGFDWRLIAAQVYQESRFDPQARSSSGAIGLMQLLPSTAKDMGFDDATGPEENLHAGIKYMAWLRDTYFADPALSEAARIDFVLAAYNAGPSRVRRWRTSAPDHDVDPNLWFGQVENLALEKVGLQPVRYVGNINKYCVLFTRLTEE